MSAFAQLHLTLILFLPWFTILGVLFWLLPRQPRPPARRWFDAIALALSTALFLASVYWSFENADPKYGAMWKQVLATAVGYGVFLAAMTVAFLLRRRWLRTLQGREL